MINLTAQRHSVVPSPAEIEQAKVSSRQIAELSAKARTKPRYALTGDKGTKIELSGSAFQVLVETLNAMAAGNAVMLIPIEAEITTQQAAELLNVSRPYLVNLLESGAIAYRNVGRYRRIRYQDILNYQARKTHNRKETMDELVSQAQELKLGY
jgi:excisionase family DNA binding protein